MEISQPIGAITNPRLYQDAEHAGINKLIEVTEPYFALTNIRFNNNTIEADVPLEHTSHMEPFGMSIAEVGRHMAILGSIALARINPVKKKHYYLATDAYLERFHDKPGGAGIYHGNIEVKEFTKRKGKVAGVITSPLSGPLYSLTVEYKVLTLQLFERMFGHEKQPTPPKPHFNPYRKDPSLYQVNLGLKSSTATLGSVRKENCIGHFDEYPAMPIARLGSAMAKISGLHLNHIRSSDEEYCIRKAEIHAKSFIFAGNKIDLISKVEESAEDEGICISAFASTKDCNNAASQKVWYY